MRKQRHEAARKVAASLFAYEEAMDLVLQRAAELNAALPAARAEAGVSAIFGQDAMISASRSLALLVEARREMVTAHQQLDEVKIQLGLREMGFGDLAPKPPIGSLRIVEAA